MIYAYDLWLPMPTKDLFDTLMMLASVNAAKDMYEKGLEEMKEFNKTYNDFLSPSEIDMQWVKDKVTDPMRDTINLLYAAGIDPLRSKEGRALLMRFKNNIDASRMAQNKLTALYGLTYLENKAKLEAAGKYDPDLEERFLGFDLKNWDSSKGAWTRLSPTEAKSLKSLTSEAFDKVSPHNLTKEEVLSFEVPFDPNADYVGVTYDDLLTVSNDAAVGLRGTIYENYYKDLAKLKLIAKGIENPTDEQVESQLMQDITNLNLEYMKKPVADYDRWYKQLDLYYKALKAVGNGSRSSGGVGSIDGTSWTDRIKSNVFTSFNKAEELEKRGDRLVGWKDFQANPLGNDALTALALATGLSSTDEVELGIKNKRLPISFGSDNTLSLTALNIFNYEHPGPEEGTVRNVVYTEKLKNYPYVDLFNKWLNENHIEGFTPNNDVSVNWRQNEYGDDVYDINTTMRIDKKVLNQFVNEYGAEYLFDLSGLFNNVPKLIISAVGRTAGFEGDRRDAILKSIGNKVGITAVLKSGKKVDGILGKLLWGDIEYVDIPVTRTIVAQNITLSDGTVWNPNNSAINTMHDVSTFTKTIGAKRLSEYETEDE